MDCCDNAGGRVELTIDGEKYSLRSAVTVRPSRISVEGGANQDGSPYYTTSPQLAEADIVLSDRCGLPTDKLINGCLVDATIRLVDVKRTYLFTRSRLTGRPSLNSENGEISGMTIMSAQARQTNRA
jgi:Phage tail tube protein